MTVLTAAPPDPFTSAPPSVPPTRPRLLSHVGRWGRARRWLPADALRILDVGCAFGYGTAAVAAAGPPGRIAIGVERDPDHLARGAELFPWVTIVEGDAADLPVPDGCADAILLLDVLEHLADPRRAVEEAHRVVRPDGILVLSVPHRGPLHRLDALNVYQALRRSRPTWPPLEPATESAGETHRHYTVRQLDALLAPWFAIDRVARTGLGLPELVYLAGLLARVPLRTTTVPRAVLPVHLLAYVLDDLLALGPLGYHVTVRARAGSGGPR